MSSSDLRRRARATLVDVFRRYVVSQLKTSKALPPRLPPTKHVRRVQSLAESDVGNVSQKKLRSVSSALTTRSSNFSLSEASVRVQCISRSPSVTVLKSYESTVGVFRGRFDEVDDDDEDELDDDEVEFGKCNEGGYVPWVTRSLLRRVETEMREMKIMMKRMNARASRRGLRVSVGGLSPQRNVGNRLGLSPVDGLLLTSIAGSLPAPGHTSFIGEFEGLAPNPALVDESLPFCDGFDDLLENEDPKVVDDDMEDIPLDDNVGEDAETTSTGTSTETDSSSVHTPSELTSFDQAEVLSPSTLPLDSPNRGEYFTRVDASAAEPAIDFEQPPRSSSPPRRRPILEKQPSLPPRPIIPSLPSQSLPRSPSPPFRPSLSLSISRPQSPSSPTSSALPLAAYAALSGERLRLLAILARLASQHAASQADEKQLLKVLEAKSMRRAWSNRAFMGGAGVRYCNLARPDRRSLLSTAEPISALDLLKGSFQAERLQFEGVEGVRGGKKRGLVVTTAESNIMRLFPVCEEEDEDSEDSDGFEDVAFRASFDTSGSSGSGDAPFGRTEEDDSDATLSDVEDGLLGSLTFPPLTRQPGRCSVPVRTRTRTKSMNMNSVATSSSSSGPLLPAPVTMGVSSSYPGSYPSVNQTYTPLTPQPHSRSSRSTTDLHSMGVDLEYGMLEPQTKVELFDVYSGDEDEDDELSTIGGGFTLAMDLPSSCDVRRASPYNRNKRRECGSDDRFSV